MDADPEADMVLGQIPARGSRQPQRPASDARTMCTVCSRCVSAVRSSRQPPNASRPTPAVSGDGASSTAPGAYMLTGPPVCDGSHVR